MWKTAKITLFVTFPDVENYKKNSFCNFPQRGKIKKAVCRYHNADRILFTNYTKYA
jgi:hypothetical protein